MMYVSKFQIILIPILRTREHAKIFIFCYFNKVNGAYKVS